MPGDNKAPVPSELLVEESLQRGVETSYVNIAAGAAAGGE